MAAAGGLREGGPGSPDSSGQVLEGTLCADQRLESSAETPAVLGTDLIHEASTEPDTSGPGPGKVEITGTFPSLRSCQLDLARGALNVSIGVRSLPLPANFIRSQLPCCGRKYLCENAFLTFQLLYPGKCTGKQRSLATGRQYWEPVGWRSVLAAPGALRRPAVTALGLGILLLEGGLESGVCPMIRARGQSGAPVFVFYSVGTSLTLAYTPTPTPPRLPQRLRTRVTGGSCPRLPFPAHSSFLLTWEAEESACYSTVCDAVPPSGRSNLQKRFLLPYPHWTWKAVELKCGARVPGSLPSSAPDKSGDRGRPLRPFWASLSAPAPQGRCREGSGVHPREALGRAGHVAEPSVSLCGLRHGHLLV